MDRTQARTWLRTLRAAPSPELRLVCFPHSGGSAGTFGGWAQFLPPAVELLAVQYPGRGDRFAEPLVDDVVEMAGQVAEELAGRAPAGTVLFGHSLGAVVAYESALVLRDLGREPVRLCVSACLPPGQMSDREIHLQPDDQFWDSLCALGGIEPMIAESAELRELLLPALRSDLRAHATYRQRAATTALSCHVECFHGEGDPLVEQSVLSRWGEITSGEYTLKVRQGGHFHLSNDVGELLRDVLRPQPA